MFTEYSFTAFRLNLLLLQTAIDGNGTSQMACRCGSKVITVGSARNEVIVDKHT